MTSDELHYQLKRLLESFQNNWAYADSLRIHKNVVETSGVANWEKIFEDAQRRAGELFQPSIAELKNEVQTAPLIISQLLERLRYAGK